MKKIVLLLIAVLTVSLAAGALGEMSFEGVIVSAETETVTAPFGFAGGGFRTVRRRGIYRARS